jgi:hypothetical protein
VMSVHLHRQLIARPTLDESPAPPRQRQPSQWLIVAATDTPGNATRSAILAATVADQPTALPHWKSRRHMSYTVSAAAIELTRRKGIASPYLIPCRLPHRSRPIASVACRKDSRPRSCCEAKNASNCDSDESRGCRSSASAHPSPERSRLRDWDRVVYAPTLDPAPRTGDCERGSCNQQDRHDRAPEDR